MNRHVKYVGHRSLNSQTDTHRTGCSIWTTKVIGNNDGMSRMSENQRDSWVSHTGPEPDHFNAKKTTMTRSLAALRSVFRRTLPVMTCNCTSLDCACMHNAVFPGAMSLAGGRWCRQRHGLVVRVEVSSRQTVLRTKTHFYELWSRYDVEGTVRRETAHPRLSLLSFTSHSRILVSGSDENKNCENCNPIHRLYA